jgi:glycosyltransferase involved in cell wall biosynthesis
MELPKTLFLSRGNKGPVWYRMALPALALGCDWTCYFDDPPETRLTHGHSHKPLALADITDYDVVIVQQPKGLAWLREIHRWQAAGVVVLAEIDDWLRGIRKRADHDFASGYDRKTVEAYDLCLRAVDGVICSTDWLAERYSGLNAATYVCRNGIDLKRYALTPPPRAHVNLGWAGATGHGISMRGWIGEIKHVMRERSQVHFVTVGQRFSDALVPEFGRERCLKVPFTALPLYPNAMSLFDIAIAPADDSSFYRGKSDLRWLESSAIGVPLVADPVVYPEIEHGVTGFHAATPDEFRSIVLELVDDADLRRRVGAAAKAYVTEHRSAQVAANAWADVIRAVVSDAAATTAA